MLNTVQSDTVSTTDARQAEILRSRYEITDGDLERVRVAGTAVIPQLSSVVADFYVWLESRPEFPLFFSDPDNLARVQGLQSGVWMTFFGADLSADYVGERRRIGQIHANIGVSLSLYLAGMEQWLQLFVSRVNSDAPGADRNAIVAAVTKMMYVDVDIVINTYLENTNAVLSAQSDSLMRMSTPVTSIWDRILMLPIVGLIDSKRAKDIMSSMLRKIADTQSRIVIVDISGVAIVDTAVANHLLKMTRATRLMGCECIISGLSPEIAETIVDLGIDVGDIRTTANLRDALKYAFEAVGISLKEMP